MSINFEKICNNLSLGNIIENAEKINGGITNQMYKIQTTKGKFAVQIINKHRIQKNKNILKNIEFSEQIATIANLNNINSISAIRFNNKYVQNIDDEYILVYKWCDGTILLTKEIDIEKVKIIANMLAKLHKIVPKSDIKSEKYTKIDYNIYYQKLKNTNDYWSRNFIEKFNILNEIYDKVYYNYNKLSDEKSYIHKDLNRKNIMWNNNTPYIVDWETATIGNSSIDFFNSAWFLTADADEEKYKAFANSYFETNKFKDNINISAYSAIIEECNWLEFSLKRALAIESNDINEIDLGKNSINDSLTEIINYYNKIPMMLKYCEDCM